MPPGPGPCGLRRVAVSRLAAATTLPRAAFRRGAPCSSSSNGSSSSSSSSRSSGGTAGLVEGDQQRPVEAPGGDLGQSQFVNLFRSAAPFIEGHRGKTFVVAISSEVVEDDRQLSGVLEDVLVLSGLGVRVVLVYGCTTIVTKTMQERGLATRFVGGYRVTDSAAMRVAMEVAGRVQLKIEAKLSRGPSVSVARKHNRDSNRFYFAPPVTVVSGNYTTAKRRGVVNGVDFGRTGEVRFVQGDAILTQLAAGNIVVMSNVGFSAVGEVLNCNIHDVASHAAIQIKADKLICMTGKDARRQELGEWMPLPEAERRLLEVAGPSFVEGEVMSNIYGSCPASSAEDAGAAGGGESDSLSGGRVALELTASVAVCKSGVKRAHLVDATLDGALLLELYSRDGVGTMISADFYEGIRPATPRDVEGILSLLQPLVAAGVVIDRSLEQLLDEIPDFTVVERESRVLACVSLKDVGLNTAGQACAELAAFCVDPAYRNGGRGDSLLDYIEQQARSRGFDVLVILTTRTADWFCCRGFVPEGVAYTSDVLPAGRRAKIDPARQSKCYSKALLPVPYDGMAPAGKRIGF